MPAERSSRLDLRGKTDVLGGYFIVNIKELGIQDSSNCSL